MSAQPEDTKELRVSIKMRNNRLVTAREQMKLSQAEAASRIGVSAGILMAYEKLERQPTTPSGGWLDCALLICCFYSKPPEWLWTDAVRKVRKGNVTKVVNVQDMTNALGLDAPPQPLELVEHKESIELLDEAMAKMPPHEQTLLDCRFGLHGKEELPLHEAHRHYHGPAGGISGSRMSQIENRALRRLRSSKQRLRQVAYPDDASPLVRPDPNYTGTPAHQQTAVPMEMHWAQQARERDDEAQARDTALRMIALGVEQWDDPDKSMVERVMRIYREEVKLHPEAYEKPIRLRFRTTYMNLINRNVPECFRMLHVSPECGTCKFITQCQVVDDALDRRVQR